MKQSNTTMLNIFRSHFEILYMYQRMYYIPNLVTFPASYFIGRAMFFSLACETGLKALAEKDNIKILHTHKLDSLFNVLPNQTKDKLLKLTSLDIIDFQKLMSENNSHFEKWRYFAEGCDTINYQFLEKLFMAIACILFSADYLQYCYPKLKT